MALVVETGSGNVSAESYASVAEADAYLAARGLSTTWVTKSESEKEQALRMATEWLDGTYRLRWKGSKTSQEQALEWPRYEAWDSSGFVIDRDTIPAKLNHATIEAALRHVETTGGIGQDESNPGQTITERNKLGPLEEEIRYSSNSNQPRYTKIEGLIAGLIMSGVSARRG